jgi:hypothetical protein
MSWKDGFFNSINGDRTYNADHISSMFEGLITSGVYASIGNKLVVEPNSGMTVQINTGRGWFGGRWVVNDSEYLLTLDPADVLLNRYAAICVRVDTSLEVRRALPYIKYGELATNAVKPEMERTDTVKEYCLAYVYIPAGITAITASQIQDTRGNKDLCGWVTGLIEQIDSTTLFAQFESLFADWLGSLQDYLDEDVEAKLVADMVEVKATAPIKVVAIFDGLGWNSQEDGTYLQTVAVNGVTADNDIFVAPTNEYKDAYIRMDCEAISQGENTVTFRCSYPEDLNMQAKVIIINDLV